MLMNPNVTSQQPYPNPKQSHTSFIVALLLATGLVISLAFGVWAFMGMQANKTDLDEKIAVAERVAVNKAEELKELEFAEREKDPYKNFIGSATFGSLSFDFPKSWSVFLEEKDSGTVLDFYSHPGVVKGTDKSNSFALRAQIISSTYDKEAEKMQKLVETGKATATAFIPKNVPSGLGIRVVGEVVTDKQGVMVLIPQRDKTIKIWTESPDFISDFDKIIETLNYVP